MQVRRGQGVPGARAPGGGEPAERRSEEPGDVEDAVQRVGEDVQQAHQPVAFDLRLQGRQGFGIDPRDHHEATKTIYQDQAQRKKNPITQFLDPKYVLDGFD